MPDATDPERTLKVRVEARLQSLRAGEVPDWPGWERLAVLERLASEPGDDGGLAAVLLDGAPIPPFRLEEPLVAAVKHGNEAVALAIAGAGAGVPVRDAARAGMARLTEALIAAGGRVNRRFPAENPPIHEAVAAPANWIETAQVLARAACDLNARDASHRTPAKLANELGRVRLATFLDETRGTLGPQWFREAQRRKNAVFVFHLDDDIGFGFDPNDVQTPLRTGGETEEFGWPNTPAQGLEYFEQHRELRWELEWLRPFLDRLVGGEDFSLDELEAARR